MTQLTAAIMAGGKSSRMGQDKSFVMFQGETLIERVKARVSGLGDELILITNNHEAYAHLDLPMFADIYPDHGPLGGIFTAVSHASHPHVLVVACDMPWLHPALLRHMIDVRHEADIVAPRWDRFPEPLHAIYGKSCLAPIRIRLAEKRLKITGFWGQVQVRYVDREESARFARNGRSFTNINTLQELKTHSRAQ